ncbi:MAG: DUF3488 domain-containing protein [Acidobacteria bacterium]|nr:DUF3488 domain-containing protein [Acidobacteriota bacterium]
MSGAAPVLPVERFFQFSMLGMLASGYLAVAGSGYLDAPTVAAMAAGLAVRALMILGYVRRELPPPWVNAATLAYAGFYPIDYAFVSTDFLAATVHFVFFLAIVKVLTAKTNRDYFFVKAVAFLEILAASILAGRLNFFVWLTAFLIFGVATFAASEVRQSRRRAGVVARTPVRRFGWRLAALSLLASGGILALTATLFFALPRTAQAAFRHLIPERYHVTGFSNEINFGRAGEIGKDSRPVLHARIEEAEARRALKWKGGVLAEFDGRRWYNSAGPIDLIRVDGRQTRLVGDDGQRRQGKRISYEVVLHQSGSDALFFAGIPEFVRIPLPAVIRTHTGSYRTGMGEAVGLRYFVWSFLAAEAASHPAPLQRWERDLYLRLPHLDARIPLMTRKLLAGQVSDLERARTIERHLRRNYGYTTELPDLDGVLDPMSHFLFERKKGHCEYFASAMALMLRSAGIPARIAVGFQSGQYNPLTGMHVIRASDAHSWVEAYIDGQGWSSFDPTPAAPEGGSGSLFAQALLLLDTAETFWNEWVLNYDLERQFELATRLEDSGRSLRVRWFESAQGRLGEAVSSLIDSARPLAPGLAVAAAGAVLFAIAGRRLWVLGMARRARLRVRLGNAQASDAALLYHRMLRILSRRGFEKPPWLTPAEFAAVLPPSPISMIVEELTAAYNDLRFGGNTAAGTRMVRLLDDLEACRDS